MVYLSERLGRVAFGQNQRAFVRTSRAYAHTTNTRENCVTKPKTTKTARTGVVGVVEFGDASHATALLAAALSLPRLHATQFVSS
jgi:hypothetical protein